MDQNVRGCSCRYARVTKKSLNHSGKWRLRKMTTCEYRQQYFVIVDEKESMCDKHETLHRCTGKPPTATCHNIKQLTHRVCYTMMYSQTRQTSPADSPFAGVLSMILARCEAADDGLSRTGLSSALAGRFTIEALAAAPTQNRKLIGYWNNDHRITTAKMCWDKISPQIIPLTKHLENLNPTNAVTKSTNLIISKQYNVQG